MKPAFFESPAAFRDWLDRNHDSADELLAGFYKRDSGRASITCGGRGRAQERPLSRPTPDPRPPIIDLSPLVTVKRLSSPDRREKIDENRPAFTIESQPNPLE